MGPGIRVILIVAGYAVFLSLVIYGSSFLTGWHTLGQRFRFEGGMFQGTKWRFQTGYMRFYSHYGGCLTVGADQTGLYLSVWPILQIGSPPLLVPWNEVTVVSGKRRIYQTIELRLGRDEQIPLRLKANLVERLRQAAGAAWPMEMAAV